MLPFAQKAGPPRFKSGFSLIEPLVVIGVIGVIGVMMALTTSGLRGWGSANKLRSAHLTGLHYGNITIQLSMQEGGSTVTYR